MFNNAVAQIPLTMSLLGSKAASFFMHEKICVNLKQSSLHLFMGAGGWERTTLFLLMLMKDTCWSI